jgi:hypothetical protein
MGGTENAAPLLIGQPTVLDGPPDVSGEAPDRAESMTELTARSSGSVCVIC